MCKNVPPVLRKEPEIVVVPVGKVTVPVAMVRLPFKASVDVLNDQIPPTPVKDRLLNGDVPRAMVPLVVPTKVTVPFCGIKALEFVQFLTTLMLKPEPEEFSVSSAPMVIVSAPTLPLWVIVLAVPSITTKPIFVLLALLSPQVLLPVPLNVVVANPVIVPLTPRDKLPPRAIVEVPRASVPKLTFKVPLSTSGLEIFQVEEPLVSPNVTLLNISVDVAVSKVELEVVAVKITVEVSGVNVPE